MSQREVVGGNGERVGDISDETCQRAFYRAWASLMSRDACAAAPA